MKRPPLTKISSVRELVTNSYHAAPLKIAFRFLRGKEEVSVTFSEFYHSVEALGAALTDMGLIHSHIACVGDNSFPWIQTYLTALMGDGVFVPLDRDLPADTLTRLIRESDAEVLFCDAAHRDMLADKLAQIPAVKCLICFDLEEDEGAFLSFSRLIARGATLPKTEYDSLRSNPHALKLLVYTSGTTGAEKGVMLTESNLVNCLYWGLHVSRVLDCGLSVLPYHHTYAAVCDILVALYTQATLCINDRLKNVPANLKRFRPSYIVLVPAFSEHFYDMIMRGVQKKGKARQLNRMIRISEFLRKFGIDLRRVFFKSILEQFGGNLRKIICGGAPIRPEIGAFFDKIGITLIGGYGITECSPLISGNDDACNNFASAGHRIPCLKWRIDSPDENGVGEICVSGDTVMLGYYKRPDLTAEVIRGGWFYTGDYGYLTPDDQVVITGRKKNIIVLNNGKNVYPEELETRIQSVDYISEVVVRGIRNSHGQDYALSAEIYMEDAGGRSEADIMRDIRAAMKEEPSYKQISRLLIRETPFEKTTTRKIKRNA